MDIGTAKPFQTKGIQHHLIDIIKPNQEFNAANFKKIAVNAIKDIQKRKKLPFLTGGTGLYIKTVVENLEIPKVKPDWNLRRKLELKIKTKGLKNLYNELIEIDPEAAYIVDSQNPRRIIRALEIAIKTKKPFSQQRKKGEPLFDVLEIGLNVPEEKLKEKIEKRTNEMIKNGLIKEVQSLIKNYNKNLPTFDAIGYREIIDYLEGKISLEDAIEKIKKNTWHFAKRQITWFNHKSFGRQNLSDFTAQNFSKKNLSEFKKNREIHWVKNQEEAELLIKKFLKVKNI